MANEEHSSSLPMSPLPEKHVSLQPLKNTMLVSHGRPPWYSEDGHRLSDAFVIGVAGGSASGKTHVARQILKSLDSIPSVVILSQDSFYKPHSPEELKLAHASQFDFDHPDAIDMKLFASCLADLKSGKQTNVPIYSFSDHQRLKETQYLYGAAIIIAEGIMALQDPDLRKIYDLKIFVQCDSDLMLARRIARDVRERGRTLDGTLEQYLRFVKPSYDNFVAPTARHADLIVPGSSNEVAIELISTHIRQQLHERSNRFKQKMARGDPQPTLHPSDSSSSGASSPRLQDAVLGLDILPPSPQLKGIFTILRDRKSSRQDFIFFVDRLSTILVEHAIGHLPHIPHTVTTPVGVEAHGKTLDTPYVCGVSILRSGGALERGFKRVMKDVPVGSLLVQSEAITGEPLLLHLKLPVCIRQRDTAKDAWVFLLDAQIGTGAAAFMSIRVLLDHGVQESHIVFVTFLVSRGGGVSTIRRVFPKVQIVCGEVDDRMQECWLEDLNDDSDEKQTVCFVMQPGMGQIGDRYYL